MGLDRHDAWVAAHGSELRPVVRVAVEVEATEVVVAAEPVLEVMWVEAPDVTPEPAGGHIAEADATPQVQSAPPSIADPVADDEPEEAGMVSVAEIVPGPVGRPTLAESLAALRAMGVDG